MVKVSEFFTEATKNYGKQISTRAFEYFIGWSGENKPDVWCAFYEKSLLNDMLSYALADF